MHRNLPAVVVTEIQDTFKDTILEAIRGMTVAVLLACYCHYPYRCVSRFEGLIL